MTRQSLINYIKRHTRFDEHIKFHNEKIAELRKHIDITAIRNEDQANMLIDINAGVEAAASRYCVFEVEPKRYGNFLAMLKPVKGK